MSILANSASLAMETSEGPLTAEMIYDAVEALRGEYGGPETHQHLVSPSGMKRLATGERTLCHTCGQMLDGSQGAVK